jgi:hypothetical protein
MKTHSFLLLAGVICYAPLSQAHLCANGNPFSQAGYSADLSWRSSISHKDNSGSYAQTSAAREAEITRIRQKMEDEVLGVGAFVGHGDTPPIEFVSADGVQESYASHSDGANHQMTVIKVGKVDVGAKANEGVLKGTLLVPASGHTGAANARLYAAKDTFTVRYEVSLDAQGTKFPSEYGDAGSALSEDAKSLGLVTANELNIPLVKNHVTRIYYFRSGSGGPAGYFDGRVIDFVWDGTTH